MLGDFLPDEARGLLRAVWLDEGGVRYTPSLVTFSAPWRVAFEASNTVPGLFVPRTEAEWAERGIRTVEAWARLRAAEAKAKADREEAARVQAEAQAAAFKAALADLTALVETVRWELRETRADLQAELQAAREDIAALRRRA